TRPYEVNGYAFRGYTTRNFQSVNRVEIDYSLPVNELSHGDTLVFEVEIRNPTDHDIDFHHPEFPVSFSVVYITDMHHGEAEFYNAIPDEGIKTLKAHSSITRKLTAVAPELEAKEYPFLVSLYNKICYAKNSRPQMITIK
ncbi:MAG: hypothetical protein FWG22_05880, partial [Prolixibacteraceae bacterium]|nr:hypothetical protein [Prolixibacteraceae bacterium]